MIIRVYNSKRRLPFLLSPFSSTFASSGAVYYLIVLYIAYTHTYLPIYPSTYPTSPTSIYTYIHTAPTLPCLTRVYSTGSQPYPAPS